MDLRKLTPTLSVSPQISAEDIPEIKAAGFTTIICNRPDAEVPPSHQSPAIGAVAQAAGLRFEVLEIENRSMSMDRIEKQRELIGSSNGPVLAYCASGTRSSIAWALGKAGEMSADEIIGAAKAAGYELEGLRPTLEQIARSGS
ncbi:TIGR01244 family sulfur transferase [Primorskyibacter sp. S87]|uniref:TIGR01244 family sulfur transferase n=1 Tax=Primorskyibacter sp. S87 TaxID=3415126 RepID=UPI003C7ABA23